MLCAEARACAVRRAHYQRTFELPVRHVAAFAEFVGDIVEAYGEKVGEHDLSDRPQAGHRGAHCRAENGLLGDWTVPHALAAELLVEPDGRLEHAARLADVLAEENHIGVAHHLLGNAAGDSIAIGQFRHANPPSA